MLSLVRCVLLVCAAVSASGYNLGANDVVFHIFTRNNRDFSQAVFPTINSISTASFFATTRPTVFTIHDYNETVAGNFNAFLINAYLEAADVNVVAVDWSAGSSMYSQGLATAPQAGRVVASFMNILSSTFMYTNEMRLVGHGLGGHVAGIAARHSTASIPYIVALDPSLHGWTHNTEILSPDDAGVVEVIHTTGSIIGYDYPLGDVDFYPNGGSFQPSCSTDANCAHSLAYVYYAESLTAELYENSLSFVSTACDSYEEAITMQCSGLKGVIFGGYATKTGLTGIYTFATNFVSPFAQG